MINSGDFGVKSNVNAGESQSRKNHVGPSRVEPVLALITFLLFLYLANFSRKALDQVVGLDGQVVGLDDFFFDARNVFFK